MKFCGKFETIYYKNMPDKINQIVKNLISSEPVVINQVQNLGKMVSVSFTGVNSNLSSNKIITHEAFEKLEVLTAQGEFNFTGDARKFGLFAEAERINSAYQFDPLFAVNCSIVDPLPHQVEAVYKFLLPLPKIRFLLADDTGAGKTIMTGLLLKEHLMRGTIERILIVTPGGLTKQWQEDELLLKFNLPFKLVNRSIFASDPNVFQSSDKIVTSIDFISREDVLNVAGNSHWDLIIFDEAHKLSAYEYGSKIYRSQRYEAAYKLSQQCEHLLLLTATPHRGRMDTFKMLLQLLDEDIFATEEIANTRIRELETGGINKFFIRRLKEDMKNWDGKPLFKERFTKTTSYELTLEEKDLYDSVTAYLIAKKAEASQSKNIHVSLALSVMQRRLVSSIYAIKNTLERRFKALQSIVEEVRKNPNLWQQRHKLEALDVDTIDDYDELEDDERDALENILSDPKKFKLFTTSKSLPEIQSETEEVKKLFLMADALYKSQQEEQKFIKLRELLTSEKVIDGEKLVLFTEHKDTLLYLEERLKNNGYTVVTIHGGKSVDERRQAQWDFAKPETQILLATDAAGEGINLQFCRLLINWDIPWNPNRLEQRMGRIHRYGQKENVLVFNMVASNTREGQVLERLLTKLDKIRESMGDDRVYDVIQDVLEEVRLEDIVNEVLNGGKNLLEEKFQESYFAEKINSQKDRLSHSTIDYKDARELKENSDEKRLQPIYVRLFFEKAFEHLGGKFTKVRDSIFRIEKLPDSIAEVLKKDYNIFADIRQLQFCFDKEFFFDYRAAGELGAVYYINPGYPLFDAVVKVIRQTCREDMLKGTILVSPDEKEDYFAFFVKSQITDNRQSKQHESITDEQLMLVNQSKTGDFQITSAAKFIDLHPPTEFAKLLELPATRGNDEVIKWSFNEITLKQLNETYDRVVNDAARRREYLETAFTHVIVDLQSETAEMQGKILLGDTSVQEKIQKNQNRINELIAKKKTRLAALERMTEIAPKLPEILGCAYVVPLTQLEYSGHYGMSRDDEAEAIAMSAAMNYEINDGWLPEDVSANNEGYDIRSINSDHLKRYIEVKGRSGADGSVMVSENEMNRLAQLGDSAWLYIVINCKSAPELFRIQNPAKNLRFQEKSKGVQFFLPMTEWNSKI
jgi:superfamily II DNA or RNA helicase